MRGYHAATRDSSGIRPRGTREPSRVSWGCSRAALCRAALGEAHHRSIGSTGTRVRSPRTAGRSPSVFASNDVRVAGRATEDVGLSSVVRCRAGTAAASRRRVGGGGRERAGSRRRASPSRAPALGPRRAPGGWCRAEHRRRDARWGEHGRVVQSALHGSSAWARVRARGPPPLGARGAQGSIMWAGGRKGKGRERERSGRGLRNQWCPIFGQLTVNRCRCPANQTVILRSCLRQLLRECYYKAA